jgi:hypothetical protein
MRAVGVTPPLPPSAGVSRMGALHGLWTNAGIQAVETREITVQRTFADFDDFWNSSTITGSIRPTLAAMSAGDEGQCAGSLPRPRRILERTGSHRRSQGGAGGFPSPCPRRNHRVDEGAGAPETARRSRPLRHSPQASWIARQLSELGFGGDHGSTVTDAQGAARRESGHGTNAT